MNIEMKATEAKLRKAKLQTEGSEENPTRRSDLDFVCSIPASTFCTLIGISNDSSFWDEEGNLKILGVKNLDSRVLLKGCAIEFGELKASDCTVRNIKFNPISGRQVATKLQIQIYHTDDQLATIDHHQKRVDDLTIKTQQADLFD